MREVRSYTFICLALALLGFAVNLWVFAPGYMTPDSFDQFIQANTRRFHDWHPPVMAAIWSILLVLQKSQLPMLCFQLVIFWSAYFLLALALRRHLLSLLMLTALMWAPFVANFSGVIWKDVLMAFCWLFSFSLIVQPVFSERQIKVSEKWTALVFLFLGCWLRVNALPAVIPLFALWIWVCYPSVLDQKNRFAVLITAITISCILTQIVMERFILKPTHTFPAYKLYMHDLSGIYQKTSKKYFPDFILKHEGFDSLLIKSSYNEATFDDLWWGRDDLLPNTVNLDYNRGNLFDLDKPQSFLIPNAEERSELAKAWFRAICENPLVYLQNRTKGFIYFLRIRNRVELFNNIQPGHMDNTYGLRSPDNRVERLLRKATVRQAGYFYMRPWFWVALNLLMYVYTCLVSDGRIRTVRWLLLSGLLYVMPQYFIFQTDTDFRYFYWNIVCTAFAIPLLWLGKKEIHHPPVEAS